MFSGNSIEIKLKGGLLAMQRRRGSVQRSVVLVLIDVLLWVNCKCDVLREVRAKGTVVVVGCPETAALVTK